MCLGALLQATSPLALRGKNFVLQLTFAAGMLSDQFYLQVQVDIFLFYFYLKNSYPTVRLVRLVYF